jgi:hypothetical protein
LKKNLKKISCETASPCHVTDAKKRMLHAMKILWIAFF